MKSWIAWRVKYFPSFIDMMDLRGANLRGIDLNDEHIEVYHFKEKDLRRFLRMKIPRQVALTG